MPHKSYWLLFGLIVIVAAVLRFYKLAEVPHGMTWDEAAIGYNGFAIIKNHRDEWLEFMPVSFRSFGDWKAPLAIYISGVFTYVFGLNLLAIRLPFVICSVAAVAGMMLLTHSLLSKPITNSTISPSWHKILSLLSGIILCFSPWHLHFSRAGFETGMALTMIIWGLWLLVLSWQSQKHIWLFWLESTSSVILLVASIYTYHSSKIMLPVLALGLIGLFFRICYQQRKQLLIMSLFGLFLLIPFLKDSLFGQGAARFNQTTVFGLPMATSEKIATIIDNTLIQFSPSFFVNGATTTFRHGDGKWGVLWIGDFVCLILGIIFLIGSLFNRKLLVTSSLAKLGLVWFLSGMIPAVLGREVPHANRTLLALPGIIFLILAGFDGLAAIIKSSQLNKDITGSHGEKNVLVKICLATVLMINAICFTAYWHDYFTDYAKNSADDFKDGYLDAFAYVLPYEYGINGRQEKEKIVFTSQYGQPYIYALLARKTSPIMYHGGSLIKYEFKDVNVGDLQRHNAVIVAGKDELELETQKAHHLIYGSDGQIKFKIFVLE